MVEMDTRAMERSEEIDEIPSKFVPLMVESVM
jgi:hypothetical protein